MKRLFLLYLIFLFLYGCNKNKISEATDVESPNEVSVNAEYAIFMYSYFLGEAEPTNKAILLMDKDSIKFIENLFLNNDLEEVCACGYDYQVQFLNKDGSSLKCEMYFGGNTYKKNNEKIHREISDLAFQMYTNPTHYIYNISIDIQPSEAIKKLKAENYFPFIINSDFMDCSKNNTIQLLYKGDLVALKKDLEKYSFVKQVEELASNLSEEG
ncbi:putative lipoprotein NlpE involved in copper resistance [Dysgonomonas sp. PH5-45]|uniref:hypothetical protein n=1 Tax=unclassified Dysgonomonas TaxID=2630389 RepID=UPI0024730AF4|nr:MULTISPECIES: hypothetical protein [unclassified Dysgonomonas]MDH6354756.1 putative lipoprotein NlpE involved in copper resistance [Dysgonomonas sp. PH5-45]MDH6387655.1 putative lipoprotein NlpE involved in copper resistance [Dysgonomonas sp. PH5-37]